MCEFVCCVLGLILRRMRCDYVWMQVRNAALRNLGAMMAQRRELLANLSVRLLPRSLVCACACFEAMCRLFSYNLRILACAQ